ncbi:MAG: hypothetical protein IKW90_02055 [Lachnospiraceae bacterium]|nr:hypothetical protein [Lachnospiraceae bacterium]MBR5177569.1 hypothetical protein [Lachnospiraceae bacterium]
MKRTKRENNVQFRKSGYSAKAIAALIAGILTMIVFLILVFYSGIKEETPKAFAVCGTAALVVSFIGLLVSMKCVREQDGGYKVPYAGMAINGITFLTYIVTYILGIV